MRQRGETEGGETYRGETEGETELVRRRGETERVETERAETENRGRRLSNDWCLKYF